MKKAKQNEKGKRQNNTHAQNTSCLPLWSSSTCNGTPGNAMGSNAGATRQAPTP